MGIHEPEQAKKNFEAILQSDPNNKAAANQVVICNAKIREQREKDKKLYSSIFNKMAENDRQVSEKNGGKWLYGWWDEKEKGVQLDVDLDQIEREKQEAMEEARAARRKDNQDFLKRYGGKIKPNKPVEINGKPFVVKEEDEETTTNNSEVSEISTNNGAIQANTGEVSTQNSTDKEEKSEREPVQIRLANPRKFCILFSARIADRGMLDIPFYKLR